MELIRWFCALSAAVVLTAFAGLLVTGEYINDGPVVAEVTESQGLHLGDLFVAAGWCAGMFAVAGLLLLPRRRRTG